MRNNLDIKDLELNALLEITQAINNNLQEDDLFRIYKFTLLADLQIEKLVLFTEREGQWESKVSFGNEKKYAGTQLTPELKNIRRWEKVSDPEFEEFEFVFSVRHKNELLAVGFIGLKDESMVQNRFLIALTNILLVAIENKKLARKQIEQEAYRRELEIAKKVQNFLFPKSLPKVEKLQIEAFYLPHNDVGGDYYDYIQMDESRFLICIADVSGKGVPAALLMSNFQASLRTLSRQNMPLLDMVNELNLTTYTSGNAENFITFFAAIYDFEKRELEYVNCGHNEIVLKVREELHYLTEGTTVLGMFDPLPFIETKTLKDLSSFFLFTYTDGLTETFNEQDEPFGFDRLKELLVSEKLNGKLDTFHNYVLKQLGEFKGARTFSDDITILSCRIQNT